MIVNSSGWMHEEDRECNGAATPMEALKAFLLHGSCGDEDPLFQEIDTLNGTEHTLILMAEKTLESEEQREAELVGMDEEEWLLDIPLGGKFYTETQRVRYKVEIATEIAGDNLSIMINGTRLP